MAHDQCPPSAKPRGADAHIRRVLGLLRGRASKLQTLIARGFEVRVTTVGLPYLLTSTTEGEAADWAALDALDLRAAAHGAPLGGAPDHAPLGEPQVQTLHALTRLLKAVLEFADARGLQADAGLSRHVRRVVGKLGLVVDRADADPVSQRLAMALSLGCADLADTAESAGLARAVALAQELLCRLRPSSLAVLELVGALTKFELSSKLCHTIELLLQSNIPLTADLGYDADAAKEFGLLPYDATRRLLRRLERLGLLAAPARARALAMLGTESFYFPLGTLPAQPGSALPDQRLLLEGSEWPSRVLVVDRPSGDISHLAAAPSFPRRLFRARAKLPPSRNLVIQRPPKSTARCRVYFLLAPRAPGPGRGLPYRRQSRADI